MLWFFYPAGTANGIPVLAALIPGLRNWTTPLDFGRSFRGKRIFGDNKTWRGLLVAMVVSTLTLALLQLITRHSAALLNLTRELNYVHLPTLLLGPALGAGALLGDAIESFCKRQAGVAPGQSWFPFDQVDFIFGALLASLPFVHLTPAQVVWTFAILIVLHISADNIGRLFRLKDRKT